MIAVIADDITGAAEIAGVCLRYGIPASFSLMPKSIDQGVLIIATNTRSEEEEEAKRITFDLASELLRLGITEVFKKTDSVLRGHVAGELEVLSDVLHKEQILLIPVNPYTGRSINHATYFVDDIPLHQTGFREDPEFPAFSSKIRDLIKPNGMAVSYAPQLISELYPGINIPDAATLEDIYQWTTKVDKDVLPAGSAAFFEMFLKKRFPEFKESSFGKTAFLKTSLFIAGSTHANSQRFVEEAKAGGTVVIEMPESLTEETILDEELGKCAEHISKVLMEKEKAILSYGIKRIKFPNSHLEMKKRMAVVVNEVMAQTHLQELFVSGGASVYAIIEEMDLLELIPVKEFKAGVVRMTDNSERLFLTFKPGSYEWPDEIKAYWGTLSNKE